ncbi:MAG: DUF2202 domain-containing protein, partial [Thiovulaceae bacterium]|nr:DUF2202 domain-containing protein [Sulfurimonadaceae bacterium]
PMLYPSGFNKGILGIDDPTKEPYRIIKATLLKMEESVEPVRLRPWLQYFKDYAFSGQHYNAHEIREQVRASDDANSSGWLLWNPSSRYDRGGLINSETSKDTLPASELSDAQKAGLIFMVEEEKVARDLYEYLYAKWDLGIFSNIAKAEQKHMDAVTALLEKYGLDYSATLQTRGSFENKELQSFYDSLIDAGDASIVRALKVGKLIEETDIEYLEGLIAEGTPEDLKTVYKNLLNRSYNHLSAFTNQLSNY